MSGPLRWKAQARATIKSDDFTLTRPVRAGYDFSGWSFDVDQLSLDVTISAGSSGDKSFEALWDTVTYSIIYDGLEGIENTNPTSYDVESKDITLQSLYARTGYTFANWSSCDVVTLYAQWTANIYTITFDADGGSAIAPITQDFGTPITVPADPTRVNYIFMGWSPAIHATVFRYTSGNAVLSSDLTIRTASSDFVTA